MIPFWGLRLISRLPRESPWGLKRGPEIDFGWKTWANFMTSGRARGRPGGAMDHRFPGGIQWFAEKRWEFWWKFMIFDRNRGRALKCFVFALVGAPSEMQKKWKFMKFIGNFENFSWFSTKKLVMCWIRIYIYTSGPRGAAFGGPISLKIAQESVWIRTIFTTWLKCL